MIKNKLFLVAVVASVYSFTCYGMKGLAVSAPYVRLNIHDVVVETVDGLRDCDPEDIQKLLVAKLPQPRPFKTGYGLDFLPQYSPIKRNLKLLCKDPQNVEDLKAIAHYLENENHLYNIAGECPEYGKGGPLGGIKRVSALALSKKINAGQWQRNVIDAGHRIVNNLPQPLRAQALEDLDRAIKNAQNNRL